MPKPHPTNSDLVVVSAYTRFDNLAHKPKGTEATHAMYTYRLDPTDGQLLLLSIDKEKTMNPAFSRYNPRSNVLYTVTESVAEHGQVVTWDVCAQSGKLQKLASLDCGGTSTCYISLDQAKKNMLVVNYWDASLKVIRLNDTGIPQKIVGGFNPNEGRVMAARTDKHVNHSMNDAAAQKERQADPHSHALVLDPIFGRIAFVPDLGKDVIGVFHFDPEAGSLTPIQSVPSGCTGRPGVGLGPRYIEFHPMLPVCYVINELSCEVAVFELDRNAAQEVANGKKDAPMCLKHIQTVITVPDAFPIDLNTCGRICVHNLGNYVLAANRGHDSIAVFRVDMESTPRGKLKLVDIQHTRGRTPRHFKFDTSGQWLIAANQDTDELSIFNFSIATGKLNFTGHHYRVPSPNFVECIRPPREPESPAVRALQAPPPKRPRLD